MIERDWHSCYSEGWTGIITPDAFAHPAKFSRGLIRRIYDHLFEQGYLHEGDTVVDPFGGVALGALHAMQHGCHWIGCELEQKFVNLGNQNIELWLATYAPHFPKWGSAVLVQGDSRELTRVVGGVVGASVSSPSYSASEMSDGRKTHNAFLRGEGRTGGRKASRGNLVPRYDAYSDNNLGNLRATSADHATAVQAAVGSPPYAGSDVTSDGQRGIDTGNTQATAEQRREQRKNSPDGYGCAPGQLGAMPAGDLQAAVGSPPYAGNEKSDRTHLRRDEKRLGEGFTGRGRGCFRGSENYGSAEGQLGAMREGDFDAMVTSPPYEGSLHGDGAIDYDDSEIESAKKSGNTAQRATWGVSRGVGVQSGKGYGYSAGQLGTESNNTFWQAARTIIEQTHQTLAPDAVAVWVCKSFVRNKKRVDFPGQWRELTEACGFETIEMIRAWLVEDRGAQYTLTGGLDERRIERKSFFRRLAESKGSPRIDYEVVIIQRRI